MSITVAELLARLSVDTSRFSGPLNRAGQQATTFEGKMKALGGGLTKFATVPLLGVAGAAAAMGSDLAEVQSKVATIFGKASKDIEKWADSAAKSFGISEKEALDAVGTFGNMFTQLGIGSKQAGGMSKSMVQLAADLGSFHNADITSVIDAQSAAFRGEYDSLQQFIPTINAAAVETEALTMTGKANVAMLTDAEKALAVQKLLLEGAGHATGDFARTADGAANMQRTLTAQFKDAAAEIGQKLLPIAEKLLGWVGSAIGAFSGLSDKQLTLIIGIGAFVAVLGPAIAIVGNVITVVKALQVAMLFLAANPIGLAIAAIAALAAGLVLAWKHSETFRNIVRGAFDVVKGAAEGLWHFFERLPGLIGGLGKSLLDVITWPYRTAFSKIAKLWNNTVGKLSFEIPSWVPGGVGGKGFSMPKLPEFHSGGIVPGAKGADVPIMAQAGETVIPAGQSGGTVINITVAGDTDPDGAAARIAEKLRDYGRKTGGLRFT